MLTMRVVSWKEMAGNHTAWTTLTLLATLVTLAGGLSRTGFVKWFADGVAAHMGGLSPTFTIIALVTVYFCSHYMFASLTAHTSAMMPVMLAVGLGIPGVPADKLALALALTTGIMGVITPLRDWARTCLLRERLSAIGGLLAACHDLRLHLPWSTVGNRRADPVGTVVSAAELPATP